MVRFLPAFCYVQAYGTLLPFSLALAATDDVPWYMSSDVAVISDSYGCHYINGVDLV